MYIVRRKGQDTSFKTLDTAIKSAEEKIRANPMYEFLIFKGEQVVKTLQSPVICTPLVPEVETATPTPTPKKSHDRWSFDFED